MQPFRGPNCRAAISLIPLTQSAGVATVLLVLFLLIFYAACVQVSIDGDASLAHSNPGIDPGGIAEGRSPLPTQPTMLIPPAECSGLSCNFGLSC